MRNLLKSFFFATLQMPLIGILALNWDRLKQKPLLGIAVAILYEIVALLISFSKKVWEELERDMVVVTANWLRGQALAVAPGFRRRYMKQIIYHFGIFNVRGLGLINSSTLPLDQVFVNLGVEPGNPQKFNLDLVTIRRGEANHQLWDFLRKRRPDEDPHAFAIIGPPGCGKTTLLQHVALTFALNRQNRHALRSFTPILLFLRDHVSDITVRKPPLADLAQDYFADLRLFPTLNPPKNWFRQRIMRGRCMILLDGLDEVGSMDQRQAIRDWIDGQVKAYPRCNFIVTSRPQGYLDAPLERAHVFEVQSFSFGKVKEFIKNWYLADELISSGNQLNADIRQRAKGKATDLILRIQSSQTLNALAVNPLLLTMVTMVHRYRGELPGSRIELYAEICEVLLGRWRQGKGIRDQIKASQKLVVLRSLAAYMMEHRRRDVTTIEAVEIIAQPLKRIGVGERQGEDFLKSLQADSGLIVEREPGHWSFAHLTLQEYLTALQWVERGREAGYDWARLITDSWWQETLRLYAAQVDATALLDHCLLLDTIDALALARDLLEESREIDPRARHTAQERLIAAIESPNLARRDIAAKVLMSRRLRTLQRIDDMREIDLEYITCAEYQLFLDDMIANGKIYKPDHWQNLTFPEGKGLEPVKGVRPDDAVAYCEWLNSGENSYRYRIPLSSEAIQFPANACGIGTWCVEGAGFKLIGIDSQFEKEAVRRLRQMSSFPFNTISDVLFGSSRADEQSLALVLAYSLDLIRASTPHYATDEELALATALARDLATYIASQLDHREADARSFSRDRKIDLEIAQDLCLDIDLSKNIPSHFYRKDREIVSVSDLLNRNECDAAKVILHKLQHDFIPSIARRAILASHLLDMAYAESDFRAREIRSSYCERLLEYAHIGISDLAFDNKRNSHVPRPEGLEALVSGMRWWRQLASAHREGVVEACESIRIVRERTTGAS